MSIRKTMITMAIMFVGLGIVAGEIQARQPNAAWLFDWKLEPVVLPTSPGPIEMIFEFSPGELCRVAGCTEAEITVTTVGGLEYLGRQSWTQQVKLGETYSEVIQVNIPPNDTCGVIISIGRPEGGRSRAVAYFVTFTNSVEYWKGDPHGATKRGPSHSEQLRARLTPEQLKEVVTIRFSLRREHKLGLARVNELVDELLPTDEDSVFTARVTRDVWVSLQGMGISCYIIDQPPPPPQPDSSLPPVKTVDSLGKQGFLDNLRKIRGDGAFAVAYPLTPEWELPPDENITIFIECLNNTGYNQKGITNGFRVYSPSGAQWTGTVGADNAAPTI